MSATSYRERETDEALDGPALTVLGLVVLPPLPLAREEHARRAEAKRVLETVCACSGCCDCRSAACDVFGLSWRSARPL